MSTPQDRSVAAEREERIRNQFEQSNARLALIEKRRVLRGEATADAIASFGRTTRGFPTIVAQLATIGAVASMIALLFS